MIKSSGEDNWGQLCFQGHGGCHAGSMSMLKFDEMEEHTKINQ
jgi:hypothetical protein